MTETSKFSERASEQQDLLSVLLAVKANIMKECRVASIAVVKAVEQSIAKVQLYPLLEDETERNIEVLIPSSLSVSTNDIVLVIYVDRNFIAALKKLKSNQKPVALTENSDLHSDRYGIIITIL